MHLERLRRDGAAVHRHAALLVHVAGGIGDHLAAHAHAAVGHQLLGGASRGHARVSEELAESHAPKAARLGPVDLKLLDERLDSRGEPGFRARQVWEWLARGAQSYDDMTNLPLELRAAAGGRGAAVHARARARGGGLRRHRARRCSARTTARPLETVLMSYRDGRRSLCLSSQSGCPLTCTFCATGRMRFGRNLTTSEILDQALHFRRAEPVTNAVFMGMGEPLMNLDSVLAACERLPDVGIPWSHTAISTVGWLPGIERLADEGPPVRLALSLHAADDSAALGAHARERALPAAPTCWPPACAGTSTGAATSSWST